MHRLIFGALLLASCTTVSWAQDATGGIKRTPLQAMDFPEGYRTVIGIAEVAPGVEAGAHSHPGIETGYVLEGEVAMMVEGEAEVTLKAGDSYAIPAGKVHNVRTLGDQPTRVIATYVVEKDKPLSTPAP